MFKHRPLLSLAVVGLAFALSLNSAQLAAQSSLDKAMQKLEKELGGKKEGKDNDTKEAKQTKDSKDMAATSGSLSQGEASNGIREALGEGVERAVAQLGQQDGFLKDQAVKILVPKKLRKLTDMASKLGAGKYVERFEKSMNRAAEKAVPEAASILGDSVRTMSVEDALALVRGGDTSATDYFRRSSSDKLRAVFLPIVKQSTESSGVSKNYKKLIDKTGEMGGLLGADDVNLDEYVTEKTMDGLFHYIAEQEKAIRKNPLGQASDLLRRVFGR